MNVHLIRIPLRVPQLLRFARANGILQQDDTLGYTLHAWFAALFGDLAPKPFRYLEQRNEVLAYVSTDAATLLDQARAFADPTAWAALDAEGMASKPMPEAWSAGRRLRLEVLTCPVTRRDDGEKDVFLRALERLGDAAPTRSEVYCEWFARQWDSAARVCDIRLLGMQSRARLLRRNRKNGDNRLRIVERPQALFAAEVEIQDGEKFGELLARGIGRHRAFGFGMILLSPPR